MFTLDDQHPRPVIDRTSPDNGHNTYGFEGGRVLKIGSIWHLFVSEMIDDPRYAKTKLAHWISEDRLRWQRVSTLVESSGEHQGQDPRAAIFLPQPIFDESTDRWNLFYATFRSEPNRDNQWRLNFDGRIWRALSTKPGPDGVDGPYEDVGVVLQPDANSDPWEGLQGTDSFFPYRVGDGWYAFYGSAQTQQWPCPRWAVGLAKAPALAGPWTRCSDLNPVPIDRPFIENPIVLQLADGTYAMVYDAVLKGRAIGWASSADGVHWSPGQQIPLAAGEGEWLRQTRTPLGLVPRGGDEPDLFDVFFTGRDERDYGCIGWVTLRWNPQARR